MFWRHPRFQNLINSTTNWTDKGSKFWFLVIIFFIVEKELISINLCESLVTAATCTLHKLRVTSTTEWLWYFKTLGGGRCLNFKKVNFKINLCYNTKLSNIEPFKRKNLSDITEWRIWVSTCKPPRGRWLAGQTGRSVEAILESRRNESAL